MEKLKKYLNKHINLESYDIQEQLFFVCCIIGLFAYGLTYIGSIILKETFLNICIMGAGLVVLFSVVIITFKYKKVRLGEFLIAFLVVYVMIPLIFFTGGGIYGGASMWFIFAILFVSMTLQGVMKLFFQISCVAVSGICYLIAYNYPDFVTTHTLDIAYKDSFIQILIIGVLASILTGFTLRMYKEQNARSERQKEEIDALNRAQNRFFSSMSHEIRTPINTIIGLNELILREDISDEVAEDASNIESASKMLLQLINDILDMSKLEAGEMKISPSSYSISNLMTELVGMFYILTKEKGLDFRVNIDPNVPTELIGDEVRIQQILINLLNNAVKYTKEGHISFTVQSEQLDDTTVNITFSVEDTGSGIKKESIPHLFSAFRRADDDSVKYVEGTGLGLAIVKQLVEMMDGELSVNSIYTQGSTFIISLPQEISDATPVGELDIMHRHSINRRVDYHQTFEAPDARVLIVDDNHANIMVLKKLLRDTKVYIDTAESGAEALKYTVEKYYDVIFMDHLMPEMDGVECMHRIREQVGGLSKESRIIALTANAGGDKKEYYIREGFDAYLLKPINGAEAERALLSMLPESIVTLINADADLLIEHGEHIYSRNRKRSLVITSESVCDLPKEILDKYNIPIIPYGVITEEGFFVDKVETDAKGIINYMSDRGKLARSVSPSSDEYEAFFAEQLTHANNVLHITMTRGLNGSSYTDSMEAAKSFDNVRVIDSVNFSCGMGLVVLEAVRLANDGLPIDGIIKHLNDFMKRVNTSFIVDSLDYMTKAGRLSKTLSYFSDAFMMHPALTLVDGRLHIKRVYFGSSRNTWKHYIKAILSLSHVTKGQKLFVSYAGISQADLEFIRQEIEKRARFSEIIIVEASASITTNCGPGSFGLMFLDE